MSYLGEEYSVESLPQSAGYDLLPPGWYIATIASADLKNTKRGDGQYIALRWDVTGPTHQGRVVWGNLNIRNPNPKAEEIGRQQFGELLRAVGLSRVKDTDQLIGGSCQIKVSVQKDKTGEYEDRNEVRGYKALAAPMPDSSSAPFDAPKPAAAASHAPWAK